MRAFLAKHRWQLLLSLILLLLLMGHAGRFYRLAPITTLEQQIYDARMQLTMPGTFDDRIVIVDIDDKSLAAIGRWPWRRDKVSTLVDRLFDQYHVAVLGFDIVFAEPDDSSGLAMLQQLGATVLKPVPAFQALLPELTQQLDYDQRFSNSLANRPTVLGYYFSGEVPHESGQLPPPALPLSTLADQGQSLTRAQGFGANLPSFTQAAMAAGHFNPAVDADGITRRVSLLTAHGNGAYEPLALAMVRAYLGAPAIEPGYPTTPGDLTPPLEWLTVGPLIIPVDERAMALVPYRGLAGSYHYIPAVDVLNGTVPTEKLAGKIVLMGTTAPGLKDLRVSPVQSVFPGVEVHANLIAGMLDQRIPYQPGYLLGAELLLLLVLGLLMTSALLLLGPMWVSLLTLALSSLAITTNLLLWQEAHLAAPLACTLLLIVGLFTLNMTYGYFFETRRKRQMATLFGQYAPPELVAKMSEDPEKYTMEGRSTELTVLFSDVRGFTSLSENMEPKALARLMNEFLTELSQVIRQQHLGTIDKYMGDCIMAFWGAPFHDPDHARQAVMAALDMQRAIEALNPRLAAQGMPTLTIGVGVNTGRMTVGDMGSQFRKAYTVMGDAVNLASRLEGLTPIYGAGVIVGEITRQSAPELSYRELDRVRVKGKAESVTIYEPVGLTANITPAIQVELDCFHQALTLYRAREWQAARDLLLQLQADHPQHKLYTLYLDRTAQMQQHQPGDDWQGIHDFDRRQAAKSSPR
ncbi:adenylate/guanylate cyclase domain-containing protein [Chitinivorax sp. B]|uniref:CHASE2 domain-containing protein n=1 Tax=Chitinivorax sp. B TaxID=2502235 RepID=UPI0010F4745D|nr:adenylate/guanylate cyclase domain-containing protein [Chitinivorax sp. B]